MSAAWRPLARPQPPGTQCSRAVPGRLPEPRRPGAFPGITCPGLEGDTIAKKSVTKDLTKAAIFPF